MEEQDFTKIKERFLKLKDEIGQLLSEKDRSSYTHLQNYLYFAYYPIFSFTEAILILCESNKSNVSKVLLRTLFEVHIDIVYHQLEDSEQKLAFSTKIMFEQRITILNEISALIAKYPNLESKDKKDLYNKEYLENAVSEQNTHKDAVLKANPDLNGIKNLKEKAISCDKGKVDDSKEGSFENMYSLIYRQLSPIAHLNIDGLQNFLKQDENKKTFFHDGDNEYHIAAQAVEISMDFSKDLYKNMVLIGSQIDVIKEIEILISKISIR